MSHYKFKVVYSLAREALAMNDTIGEVVYSKAVLILGPKVDNVPTIIDIYSTNLVENGTVIKEAFEEGEVTNVRIGQGEEMIAKCLTKPGASRKI